MTQNRFYSSTTKATTTTADPGAAGTTLTVADSTVFASLDGQFPWTGAINWGLTDQELVNVTARPTGTTLTIVRGQDGTAGVSHPVGATVTHDVSARDFNEAGAHIGATAGVHGVTGSVVGTSDSQTLTNKTLTTPTIASFVNANHTHADAASGGLLGYAAYITNGGTLSANTSPFTPANVPNLTVNVVAGNTYEFSAYVLYQGTTTSSTAKVCMGGTCAASFVAYASKIQAGADGGASLNVQCSLNPGAAVRAAAATTTANINQAVTIDGIIVVSSSGTLTVQFGAGTATINVQAGGMFTLRQIA